MQINSNSNLVSYAISDIEDTNGRIFNYLQCAVIQNRRVEVMDELAHLKPDELTQPGKETYWQRQAYLRGELDALTHMLDTSKALEASLDPNKNNPDPDLYPSE